MPKSPTTPPDTAPLPQGTIVALHRLGCVVEADGSRYECKRKKDADLCVGDTVTVRILEGGRAAIQERLPRSTWFARGVDGGRRRKLVVANADVLLIVVATAQPVLQPGLIDRFLVLAGVGRMQSILCVNKMDLPEAAHMESVLGPYEALDMPVIRLAALRSEGVDKLRAALDGKRTVCCGFSGVGKSTLINALVGDHERLRTGDVSAATGKGTHTTTWIDWIELDPTTVVIDTPGIRQLSLAMLEPRELQAGFPEFDPYTRDCEFADCRHHREPHCAVQAAAERRAIHPDRYARYRAILENP